MTYDKNVFPAHIKIKNGEIIVQSNRNHLVNTAKYCSEPLRTMGLQKCGYMAGLGHDLGKWTIFWKKYIEGIVLEEPDGGRTEKHGVAIHTFQGVKYILDTFHSGAKNRYRIITAELIAYAIGAHHGQFDCINPGSGRDENGFDHRRNANDEKTGYEEAKRNFESEFGRDFISRLFDECVEEVRVLFEKIHEEVENDNRKNRYYEMYMIGFVFRMLTSALVHADHRDTAEFYRECDLGDIPLNIDRDIRLFEEKYGKLEADSDINRVRGEISDQCVEFAKTVPAGIYRNSTKTGGGKTLSILRAQLYHAKKRGLKKIINITPLLSIIDQNSDDIKKYLPEETILEHHSNIIKDEMTRKEADVYNSMTDMWNAPVIITTLVQFLEILFGGGTGSIARMSALMDSCIVIDEVQSVPANMYSLFSAAMNFLVRYCNCTVFLSSATQPAFEKLPYPMDISEHEMVRISPVQEAVFNRCRYLYINGGKPVSYKYLVDFASGLTKPGEPVIIVCNTTKQARKLYKKIKGKDEDLVVRHLSAKMCRNHRSEVLSGIRERLERIQGGESGERLIVVSTQIVEAGVNLSFRHVIRIAAGCENTVQAGGRCNRSLEYKNGDVYYVELEKDNNLRNLPDINNGRDSMKQSVSVIYGTEKNAAGDDVFFPEDESFIRDYYSRLFSRYDENDTMFPIEGTGETIGDLLSSKNRLLRDEMHRQGYFFDYRFRTAAEAFHIFDRDALTVITPYGEGTDICEKMLSIDKSGGIIPVELIRKAGQFSVQIFEYEYDDLLKKGLITPIAGGRMFILDRKAYDNDIGCDDEAVYDIEDFIF